MNKLICFLFLTSFSFGQPSSPYLFEKKTLKEVAEMERNLKSDSLGFKKTHIPYGILNGFVEDKDYFPLKYRRTNETFQPACEVAYFYTKDSIVSTAIYLWNIANDIGEYSDRQYVLEEQLDRKDEYLCKYNAVRNEVSKIMGNPYRTIENKEIEYGIYGKTIWQSDGRIVKLLFLFDSKLKEKENYKGTHFTVQLSCDLQKL